MEIKIYREPENESLMIDENQLKEYNKLASELGLSTEVDSTKTPNVYIALNDAMSKQLKVQCPVSVNAEEYTRTTIPLEVLKVYKYAKDNEMFDGFEVWYADKEPDPLLVGWKWDNDEAKEKNYSWMKTGYLIARWGDCALELDDLLKRGYDLIKQNLADSAQEAKEKSESMLKNTDLYVRKYLNGEHLSIDISTGNRGHIF